MVCKKDELESINRPSGQVLGVEMKKLMIALASLIGTAGVFAADCVAVPPSYTPIVSTFEGTVPTGTVVVDVTGRKSPVVEFISSTARTVTIDVVSGAHANGGNGKNAQVCIWRSWNASKPCSASPVSQDGFNDWDGKAGCTIEVPAGSHYVRAMQYNENADELATSIKVTSR
jgi:hypothetical protein